MQAEEVTYRVVRYNADAGSFVLQASGEIPEGSYAEFWNDYGATTGNRFNQIPRNKQAALYLYGWEDCTIHSITLEMCSNNRAGTLGVSVTDGANTLVEVRPREFTEWFPCWVSKDLNHYVELPVEMASSEPVESDLVVTLKGGTPEGSVYVRSITIDYDPGDVNTVSPLGYVYQKVEAKGTLSEGDVVILYRSGDAAGDIDGMEKSTYLDAIGLNSTGDVMEPDVCHFTLARDESGSHWTLTDQWDRQLGASGAQNLTWDAGVLTWDITLGYEGATIASTNTKYGTMRYNAPSGSYPRFWNYTSKSLPLPYIFKRIRQNQPIQSTAIQLPETERTVALGSQDTLVIQATLSPDNVTDSRIQWYSTHPEVASVQSGIVFIHAEGETQIVATAHDGGCQTQMLLRVTAADGVETVRANTPDSKFIRNHRVIIRHDDKEYNL